MGAAIGYRVHRQLRLEAEYSYRFNKAESWFTQIDNNGVPTSFTQVGATGRLYSHAGMFNAIFDLSKRRIRCANAYFGVGMGVLTIDADITAAGINYTSDDSRFAYQLIGGVNYTLTQRIELFADYRYLAADDLNLTNTTGGVPFGDVDFRSHNLFLDSGSIFEFAGTGIWKDHNSSSIRWSSSSNPISGNGFPAMEYQYRALTSSPSRRCNQA